jgi:hypothetical protein
MFSYLVKVGASVVYRQAGIWQTSGCSFSCLSGNGLYTLSEATQHLKEETIMVELQRHLMQLTKTYPSGDEEWSCPTCGRRYLMQWFPAYKKVVLTPGDEYALHQGSKGGLQIGQSTVDKSKEPRLSDELRAALEEALKNADLDDQSGAANS